MKRVAFVLGFASLLAPSVALADATFNPDAGVVRLSHDALRTYDFETPDSLVGLELGTWDNSQGAPALVRTPIASVNDVAGFLTTGADDVLEGSHALRLGNMTGIVIRDASLFDSVKNGRFEVTFWGRADGTSPQLYVVYDRDPNNVMTTFGDEFALVRAIRTGRQTSDGWAEISTGPLDGNVWGVPVRGILVVPSSAAGANDHIAIDALEVKQVDGKPTAPIACNQATVDSTCGPEGDCMFGHCVSSTVTWGVLPPQAHRSEIAERWILYGTRLIGDRAGAARGLEILAPQSRALAASATSSRQFYGGMNRLVNLLRDNHTSFGSPGNYTNFAPQAGAGGSSTLGACFGVVEKDLLGGGLGFAVFRANAQPVTGVPLKRGDVLFSIDGRDPKEWVDEMTERFGTTLPNDSASMWGSTASSVARLVTTRANTITLLRCASASSCTGADRQLITIDIANVIYNVLTSATPPTTQPRLSCTQRFIETVPATGSTGPNTTGEDPVRIGTGSSGETLVQFDGFEGQTAWKASMASVFASSPARVIMDARMGHGGLYDALEALFDLVRGTSEPIGVLSLGRGTYDLLDPPWLLDRLSICTNADVDPWTCLEGNATGFFTSQANPPGATSRIAWLNTFDVSANDFMPRLLQGRSNVKIFAPHATAGAFGAIADLPGIATNWSGGSLQVEDSRFSVDKAGAVSARWESGHGVEPDVVVAEKLSDALNGVDTIVVTATAWLTGP